MSRRPVRGLAFVDTETTGLGPDANAWEIAMILRDGLNPTGQDVAVLIHIEGFEPTDFEPPALQISGFEQRYGEAYMISGHAAADLLVEALADRHIVAANPAFDARILERALAKYSLGPSWHFRLIDVEALAMGAEQWSAPKGLQSTATALDIHFDPAEMHTAMGDARLALRIYDRLIWGTL